MGTDRLEAEFVKARTLRRTDPAKSLEACAKVSVCASEIVESSLTTHPIEWDGAGEKDFVVLTETGTEQPFSRGLNLGLWIEDSELVRQGWERFSAALFEARSSGSASLTGFTRDEVDRLLYTAVVGFGAVNDIIRGGNRGGPGSYFEMVMGPTLELLTGRKEQGGPTLPIPGSDLTETIPIDITFPGASDDTSLAVPTKISTRERISQAYVHQRMLEVLQPGRWRTILCVANENNRLRQKGAGSTATPSGHRLVDTLVPGTIVQYRRYISTISTIYYLDPPQPYLQRTDSDFPSVKRISSLLFGDLVSLLESKSEP